MKELLRFVKYLLLFPIYLVSYFVKKNDKIWLFGAWSGTGRGDNSEAFFQYVTENRPDIKAVWLTKSKEVIRYFRNKGWQVHYANSLWGTLISLRARVGILNCDKSDLNRYCLNRTNLVQLWHGVPFKKIEADSELLSQKENRTFARIKRRVFPFLRNNVDYVVSPSEESVPPLASAFQVPRQNVLITGYPRNDVMLRQRNGKHPLPSNLNVSQSSKDIILYAPTFRDSKLSSLKIFESFDAEKMNQFLKTKEATLIIKGHPHVSDSFERLVVDATHIHVSKRDDIPDVNPFLPYVDILITDYSSIFFDFLLLDRPIVFAPFDLEAYLAEDREMYYDYEDVTPGPKAYNWDDVTKYIEKYLLNPKLFGAERAFIRNRFNRYCDARSSERLFNEICTKILKSATTN